METKSIVGILGVVVVVALGWMYLSSTKAEPTADVPPFTTSLNTTMTTANPTATFKTSRGDFTVELYADKAPKTVENFVKLAREGFYDGTKFHRVIKGFMNQGGDPLTKDDTKMNLWGTGGPGYQFSDEFNDVKLTRGVLAMANSGPNTNGSQFFVVTAEATPWLDGAHTPFGMVTSGMDVVEAINMVETVEPGSIDRPVTPVVVRSIEIQ